MSSVVETPEDFAPSWSISTTLDANGRWNERQSLGAFPAVDSTHFAVHSATASALSLCLFDGDTETQIPMVREGEIWSADVAGVSAGQRYGCRAFGEWNPQAGLWFDPAKLLVDPYATHLDRRFAYDPRLSEYGADTASLVPKAIVTAPLPPCPLAPPQFAPGGLIYEINVRGFTMLHPDIPPEMRGTVAALGHPAIIAHLQKLHVSAVELMPVAAWIDERHLSPLGLTNAWGYNPVAMMALDPGLVPGGVAELRATVAALHAAGIGVILDLVFNHTGESDCEGPILSMRGLDNHSYYAHGPKGTLINDSGCGNTLNAASPVMHGLIIDSLRHFVDQCGVDGFRFDLAPIMARGPGFSSKAPIFAAIAADPLLTDRIMIAEPWDIGPGGYQLGQFPSTWLEWNDRYRDDVRRFWRGDGSAASLATRVAGSSDIFGCATRSVNFLAAHDGFTLADTVAYELRHNLANGEANRDGHGDNHSWNNGVEGPSDDPVVLAKRHNDLKAMLATVFASSGTFMLTAGDEFGRTQRGNNNAYAQDNATSWIDWAARDIMLEDYACALSATRAALLARLAQFPEPAAWSRLDGAPMTVADWENPDTAAFICDTPLFTLRIDRQTRTVAFDAKG